MNTQMIDSGVTAALRSARDWAKAYAMIMAIYVGLVILAVVAMGFVSNSSMQGMPGGFGVLLLTVLILLAFTLPPILYLFGFVRNSDAAISSGSPAAFATALTKLKSFFKFYVVLILVVIAIYAIALIAIFAMGGLHNLTM